MMKSFKQFLFESKQYSFDDVDDVFAFFDDELVPMTSSGYLKSYELIGGKTFPDIHSPEFDIVKVEEFFQKFFKDDVFVLAEFSLNKKMVIVTAYSCCKLTVLVKGRDYPKAEYESLLEKAKKVAGVSLTQDTYARHTTYADYEYVKMISRHSSADDGAIITLGEGLPLTGRLVTICVGMFSGLLSGCLSRENYNKLEAGDIIYVYFDRMKDASIDRIGILGSNKFRLEK